MEIGIVGTGSVGRALGTGFTRAGHSVRFGTRLPDREDVRELVASVAGSEAGPVAWAAEAPVLVLAVPADSVTAILDGLDYDGVLVDPTNRYPTAGEESQYDVVCRLAPDARVVKAFNTLGAEVMTDLDFDGVAATMLVAGEDVAAKETVIGLAADLGFHPLDAGDGSAAPSLEDLARLWIRLAVTGSGPASDHELGREFAFVVHAR
jgi:hypothetical protein